MPHAPPFACSVAADGHGDIQRVGEDRWATPAQEATMREERIEADPLLAEDIDADAHGRARCS